MNAFELLAYWLASVCGLAAFRPVEAKAGFWAGSAVFMAVACAALFSLQFLVNVFSGKSRGDGETAVPGGGKGTSEKEHR